MPQVHSGRPGVISALDAVPDPDCLLIYRGRGGSAAGRVPRRPRPAPGAAALELGEPREEQRIRLDDIAADIALAPGRDLRRAWQSAAEG